MRQVISPLPFLLHIPDWRDQKRITYRWDVLWTVILTGLITGPENILALSEWLHAQRHDLTDALGIPRLPRQAAIYRFFWKLDEHLTPLRAALLAWVKAQHPDAHARLVVLSGDGKTLKGSGREGQAALSFLSVFFHELSLTVTQIDRAGRHEAKGMLDLLPDLQAVFGEDWLLTLDAAYTEQPFTQAVLDAGGQYFVPLKNNTRVIKDWAAFAFGYKADNTVQDVEHRSGEVWEKHTQVTNVVPEAIQEALPEVKTLIRREHLITKRDGSHTLEVRYAVSSMLLTAEQAETIWRTHWGIENRSHHRRDTVLHEDACRLRCGAQGRAVLNGAVLALLLGQTRFLTSFVRSLKLNPRAALRLIRPELG